MKSSAMTALTQLVQNVGIGLTRKMIS